MHKKLLTYYYFAQKHLGLGFFKRSKNKNRFNWGTQEVVSVNTGLFDLACKIDFAYFLCVATLSCTYTKTTNRLTGSFIFFEFFKDFRVTRTSARDDHCQGLKLPQL